MINEDEIYQEHILDHYEDPYHRGTCQHPTHRHEDDNPLCGDVVLIELDVDSEQRVKEAWFRGEGCCISQAAASMLMQRIEGLTLDEVRHFTAEQMLTLFGARLTPNRQKCCLLSWRVVQTATFSSLNTAEEGKSSLSGSSVPLDSKSLPTKDRL